MKKKNIKEFFDSDSIRKLQKAFKELEKENYEEGKKLHTKSLEKYVLSTIIKAEKEECSYRYLIYEVLEAGMGSYAPLQIAGLLEFHNNFYDDENYLDDYKLDFKGKEDYYNLNEDERISLISYIIKEML